MSKSNSSPTHSAYTVREGSDGKKYYNRLGSVWSHKTGGGFSIQLFANPIDGRIVVFPRDEKVENEQESEA